MSPSFCSRLTVCPLLLLLCHHLLLLLLGRLLGDDLTWQQLLLRRSVAGHVRAERMDYTPRDPCHDHVTQSPVVRNLTVPDTAHQTSIVEILWTVIRVAKVLLEVLWRLVVAVRGVIQLHVGASLVRDAPTGLKQFFLMLCVR